MEVPDTHPPQCCADREQRLQALLTERDSLRKALRETEERLELEDRSAKERVSQLSRSYNSSLAEMRVLLFAQGRWKGEVEALSARFESRAKELREENRCLRVRVEDAGRRAEEREAELEEARELNGVYTAKLTRMQRMFKKLRDEDEESYMEMTF